MLVNRETFQKYQGENIPKFIFECLLIRLCCKSDGCNDIGVGKKDRSIDLKNNRIGGNTDEDERRSTLHNERN